VGRLGAEKGIDQLLASWPNEEELDVVGAGPLEQLVRSHADRNPKVRVLGLLPREAVLNALPSYTGLIVPSMCTENLPTVILEALAAGVPSAVSHHVQAAGELVSQGAALAFSPGGTSLSVSAVLSDLDERGPAMRLAAGEVYRRRYSPEAWQSEIDRIYASVLRGPARELDG